MIIEKIFNILAVTNPSSQCGHGFLTLKSIYAYLPNTAYHIKPDGSYSCDITNFNIFPSGGHSDIALILAAVVDDLLQVAGLVALAFLIVGSIKFITSEGNPENAANARSTIINALAGLAISVIAVVFINFIGTNVGK